MSEDEHPSAPQVSIANQVEDGVTAAFASGLVTKGPKHAAAAIAELQRERRRRMRAGVPIIDFVGVVSYGQSELLEAPCHLARVANTLRRTETEAVRSLIAVPPSHGATTLLLHAIVQRLMRVPKTRVMYVSYSEAYAHSRLKRCKSIAAAARADIVALTACPRLETSEGGFLEVFGIGSKPCGTPCDLLIVDAPYANRADAASSSRRAAVYDSVTQDFLCRVAEAGSVIVVGPRWHPEDIVGSLLERGAWPWELQVLSAVNERREDGTIVDPSRPLGAELWPKHQPIDHLDSIRKGITEYDWASLYQQRPPRAGAAVR